MPSDEAQTAMTANTHVAARESNSLRFFKTLMSVAIACRGASL